MVHSAEDDIYKQLRRKGNQILLAVRLSVEFRFNCTQLMKSITHKSIRGLEYFFHQQPQPLSAVARVYSAGAVLCLNCARICARIRNDFIDGAATPRNI